MPSILSVSDLNEITFKPTISDKTKNVVIFVAAVYI